MKQLSIVLLFVLCGCSTQPMMFSVRSKDLNNLRARVAKGLKPFGANHIISHYSQRLWLPMSVYRAKVQLAAEAGIQFSRIDVPLGKVSDKHLIRFAAIQALHREHGIELVAQLPTPNHWKVEYSEIVTKILKEAARNYPLRYWMVGNEPDNTNISPEDHAKIVKVVSRAIKSVLPNAKIIAPQLGHGKYINPMKFLREFNKLAYRYYDILSIHPYHKGRSYVNEALHIVPGKEVWITEDGNRRSPVRAMRGAYMEYLRNPRITKIFWYAFGDLDTEQADWNMIETHWRQTPEMQIPSFSKRKQWYMYRKLTRSVE